MTNLIEFEIVFTVAVNSLTVGFGDCLDKIMLESNHEDISACCAVMPETNTQKGLIRADEHKAILKLF